MREIVFLVGSILVLALITSAINFNPVMAKAQVEHAIAPPAATHAGNLPADTEVHLSGKTITPTPPVSATISLEKSFEELYKDHSVIYLLFDVSTEVHEDFSYTITVHKKVRIQKDDASSYGEITIPYIENREEVVHIEAYTTTPDGKKHPYTSIQDKTQDKSLGLYSDERAKIVTLPKVNVGCVLEYKAVIEGKHGPIKNAFWDSCNIECTIPIKEQKISYTFPKSLNIRYKSFYLFQEPEITEDEAKITYSWHNKNVYMEPERESFIPLDTPDLISGSVEFSSLQSWADVSDWYYAAAVKNLKLTDEIKEAAKEAASGDFYTRDKTRSILEYVQKNFRYVSMSFGENGYEPHPTDIVFKNKYGDCKDLSLLCLAMLKALGIESNIALFNTEYSVSDPKHGLPMPTCFSHVLVLVKDPDEGDFYIDPLLEGYNIGEYPMRYQAAYTFIITEDGGVFDRLPVFDEKRYSKRSICNIKIEDDGSCIRELANIWYLDFSIEMRRRMRALNEEKKKALFESFDNKVSAGGEMLERRIEGLDREYGPIKSYLKVYEKDAYPIADNMIIINMPEFERTSEFTKNERKNNIFYPENALIEKTTTYRIPEGFEVSHLPEDLHLDIGFIEIKKKYTVKGDTITVKKQLRDRRMEIPREDYHKVKKFFDELPAKTRQRIILKKRKKPWWSFVRE
ncbi:MAG: DUF3857 domain-containing transglutaminase family protein [Candidatus Omnitrophica bacterium]|nr:DUF3857 domain-containing transglutaminase family protein [Candidatus Omnitrophota bacterium]